MLAFDIGVLCSLSEGFSNSVLEYMASGLPIVATRVGGATEQIRDGETGLLVPSGDSSALAAALVRLISDPQLRDALAGAARNHCQKHFSMDTMIKRMDEYYSRLAAR
ncbi:MAG: glycosyltransferase family 4 protein [Nitrospirota bacterium]